MTASPSQFTSPEEVLAHYGVKGMRWGVTSAKPSSAAITDARIRIDSQQRQLNRQADRLNTSTGKQQEKEAKKFAEMKMDFLKNPDRATALRLTKGEKYILTALAVGIPGAGTAVSAIRVGTNVAVRKSIERQQKKLN